MAHLVIHIDTPLEGTAALDRRDAIIDRRDAIIDRHVKLQRIMGRALR